MKPKAYVLVFDGLADWEPAHASCEIKKSGKYEVLSVGFSERPVTTMGGLKLTPEVALSAVDPSDTAIFIMPGGEMWEGTSHPNLINLLHGLKDKSVPIGAICAATLEVARAGLTHETRHTSNGKNYLKKMVPEYKDESYYVSDLAVADRNLITASGLGSLEFAREIIKRLKVHADGDTETWFHMFKTGVIPEKWAQEA
jgi:putative intracellular protease/amidase